MEPSDRRPATQSRVRTFIAPLIGALLLVVAGWTGCGPTSEDRCKEVTCEAGVCDPSSGLCINPPSCGGGATPADAGGADAASTGSSATGSSACLPGFACVDQSCQATISCSDSDDCRSGICQKGACLNPDSCSADQDCRTGSFCGSDGTCQTDKCADKSCSGGVCEPATGKCVNPEECSEEASGPGCLDDYTCLDRECVDEEELCLTLSCDRGVCSFNDKACVDAETCSEDAECLEGKYCNADGECTPNVCDPDSMTCERGVCDPSEGCVNADTCQAPDDCLPDHHCVEGACLPTDEACGADGCPGNQICDYDAQNLQATCAENDDVACTDAIDCSGDRVCRAGACTDAADCAADRLEPNDQAGQATDFLAAARHGSLTASICSGDTDRYTYRLEDDPTVGSTLRVALAIPPSQVGLGGLDVEIRDSMGMTLARKSLDHGSRPAHRIYLEADLGSNPSGDYTITVGDEGDTLEPGVDYELFADAVGSAPSNRCSSVADLTAGQTVQGDTSSGTIDALHGSCIDTAADSPDTIHAFTLQQQKHVELELTSTGGKDLGLSLRRDCQDPLSEVACRERNPGGQKETISRVLQPGRYIAIVHAARNDDGGAYELTYRTSSVDCGPGDSTCKDDSTIRRCTASGSFKEELCNLSCNQTYGLCESVEADTCRAAVDASGGISDRTIDWQSLDDDFSPDATGCLADPDDRRVDGTDAVFEVTVPKGGALWAKLSFPREDAYGSLYLRRHCGGPSGGCLATSQMAEGDETLTWENRADGPRTVYLVADSRAGIQQNGTLDVQVGTPTCTPDETKCTGDNVQTCNAVGVGYKPPVACPAACTMGACNGHSCSAPIAAGSGGSWTLDAERLDNSYSLSRNDCAGESLPGPDAIFEVSVPADQTLTASADPGLHRDDPAIYITSSCGNAIEQGDSCLTGADLTGEATEETAYLPAADHDGGTYFVVVDSENPRAQGEWQVSIQTTKASCTPGQTRCGSTGVLEYCGPKGLGYQTFQCQGSNTSCVTKDGQKRCKEPSAEVCADPKLLTDGASISGDFAGSNDYELPRGLTGGCYVEASSGTAANDDFYALDLSKGDLVTADLTTQHNGARMYLVGDCQRETSCRAGTGGPSETLTYRADADETVYLVVDSVQTSQPGQTYTLDVTIEADKACNPGQTLCTDATTVGICNRTGTATSESYTCANGCIDGACRGAADAGDSCPKARDVGRGTVIWGNYGKLSADTTLANQTCTGSKTPGPDTFYKVQLSKGDLLTASVDSLGDDEPAIYLAGDCSALTSSCLTGDAANDIGGEAKVSHRASSQQTVLVGVDAQDARADDDFILRIGVTNKQCTPGATACDATGSQLKYCDSSARWQRYSCDGGCSMGTCNKPTGEVCFDPIPLSDGDIVSGDFSGTDNVTLFSDRSGGCYLPSGQKTNGADTVYAVDLQKGDLLKARLQTNVQAATLMVMEECYDTGQCVTNNAVSGTTNQFYHAETARRVYLVVDAVNSTIQGRYDLSVDISSGRTCAPGDTRCKSGASVGVCNRAGTGYTGSFQCAGGCQSGSCLPRNAADQCATAPLVSGGIHAFQDPSTLSDDVTFSGGGCSGVINNGAESFYRIDATKGQTYHIEAVAPTGGSPAVFITGSCANPSSSCLTGQTTNLRRVDFHWTADTAGTYYVAFDMTGSGMTTPLEVSIDEVNSSCQPGGVACGSTSDAIAYCNRRGEQRTHRCLDACTNGSCNYPRGDSCVDAIELTDGDTYTGDLADRTNTITQQSGSCGVYTDRQVTAGSDALFRVDLQQGEMLDARLKTPGDDLGLFVYETCPTGLSNGACQKGAATSDRLRFIAPKTKTYFLAVDSSNARNASRFTLEVDLSTGNSCVPGARRCTRSGKLEVCREDGSGIAEQINCPNGCHGGRCKPPSSAANTCGGAVSVTDGMYIHDSWSRYKDTYDPSGGSPACVSDAKGPEAVYEVTLDQGERMTAELISHGTNLWPSLYLLSGCSNPSSSCVTGDYKYRFPTATIRHLNDTGVQQTYYLVADSESLQAVGQFVLDVDIERRECDPSTSSPSCTTMQTSESCTSDGRKLTDKCYFGCDTSTGSCADPPNDTCSGATTITSPGTFTADIGSYNHDYKASFGFFGQSCTGGRTRGRDAVYEVSLDKGDILDLNYDAPGEAALWVTASCGSGQACIKGADGDDPEHLRMTAPMTGTYYIMADINRRLNPVDGKFTLTVNHLGPPSCTPGTTTCDSGGTHLEACAKPGLVDRYKCQGGCSGGACNTPTGGICADAISLTTSQTVTGDFGSRNAIELPPSAGKCSYSNSGNRPIGGDRIYAIPLKKGESLTAEYVSSASSAVMYLLETCTDTSTCQRNVQPGPEGILRYDASQQQTVYLVMDRATPGSGETAEYELDVQIK